MAARTAGFHPPLRVFLDALARRFPTSRGLHSSDDRWEVSVWGRNLTDEHYWSAVRSNANVVVGFPGQTRTFGASFTVKY